MSANAGPPDRSPRLAAVIGWPIGHSLSPLIHRTWADREGAPAYYIPLAVEPGFDAFAAAASRLSALGFAGANVTIPHKENALKWAGRASPDAAAAGAANMITFDEDAAYADNSDIGGFAQALDDVLASGDPRGRALVLGAGGAARGVALALQRLGYEEIVICNRTAARAEALARRIHGGRVAPWEMRSDLAARADVLVNATALGMTGQARLDIDLAAAPGHAIVSDIVYDPLVTPLLAEAAARGLRTLDGLVMLMNQAAPGYRAWLGEVAQVDGDLRRRLENALRGSP